MLKYGSWKATAAICLLLSLGQNAFADLIPNGGSVAGLLDSDGQVDSHTFEGTAGQRGVISVSGTVLTGEVMNVFNPDSSVLASLVTSNTDIDLTQNGTYSVTVEANSSTGGTGPYQVHLALAPGANEHGLIPNGGSASEAIDADGEIDSFTFEGVAGQQGLFSVSGSVASGEEYYVFNPDGTLLVQAGSHARIDLTQTGTYTVIVRAQAGSGTGPFELHLALAQGADEHGEIPNDGSLGEAIDADGEIDSFTFFGADGATGTLSIAGSVAGGDYVYVFNPDGSQLGESGSSVGLNLTQNGIYTVVVQSFNSSGTGPYTLSLALTGLPVVPLPLWSLVLLALGLGLGPLEVRRRSRRVDSKSRQDMASAPG